MKFPAYGHNLTILKLALPCDSGARLAERTLKTWEVSAAGASLRFFVGRAYG